MSAMTDPTALAPVPGFIDLHDRLRAGETLYGSFVGPRLAGRDRDRRASRLRLADHRPRARRRHRIRAARPAPRDGCDEDGCPGPAAVGRAAADRAGARPRRARDHGPAGGPPRAGARGDLVHALSAGWRRAGWRCRPGARVSASWGTATSRPSTGGSSGSSRSNRRARSSTRPRSPPSTASTSCSSARPTCRTASACPAGSTTRATSTPLHTVLAATEAAGKAAGILLYDPAVLARHRELGFRFIGLGADGGVRGRRARGRCWRPRAPDGAIGAPAPACRLMLTPRSAPRHRAASPARARRAGAAPSGRPRRRP